MNMSVRGGQTKHMEYDTVLISKNEVYDKYTWHVAEGIPQDHWFDFIECFTTNFLRAHSWLNWVDEDDDEDEVGLKEKPEDTRYIKRITSK